MKVLRWLKNAVSKLVFVSKVFYQRAMLYKYTENVLAILLYPEPTIGPPWLGPEKNFQTEGPHKVGKHYSKIGFCKYGKFFL